MRIIWVLVNCHSIKEAEKIGKTTLKARTAACFDVFPRASSFYFWPPKKGKLERAKGATLAIQTLPGYRSRVEKLAKTFHSDTLPFIGTLSIEGVHPRFVAWMRGELEL